MSARQWLAAHRPRARSARLAAELAGLREQLAEAVSGLDALDLGVISADLNGSRANARVDAVFRVMQELTAEIRDRRPWDTPEECEPSYEISDGEQADANMMPPGHLESLTRELDPAEEEEWAGLRAALPGDEFAEIVAEDFRQRNGGAS